MNLYSILNWTHKTVHKTPVTPDSGGILNESHFDRVGCMNSWICIHVSTGFLCSQKYNNRAHQQQQQQWKNEQSISASYLHRASFQLAMKASLIRKSALKHWTQPLKKWIKNSNGRNLKWIAILICTVFTLNGSWISFYDRNLILQLFTGILFTIYSTFSVCVWHVYVFFNASHAMEIKFPIKFHFAVFIEF